MIKSSKDENAKSDLPFEEEESQDKVTDTAPNKEAVRTEGEADTLTPAHLKVIKDLQEEVAELSNKVSASATVEQSYEEAIKEDWMEQPNVYFAFSSYYAIYDDKRHGHIVKTPYERPYKFKRLYRTSRPSRMGRGQEVITVAQCTVQSKKEVEWLEKHSLSNIKFFKSINKAKNVDAELAEKMVEANSLVSQLNDHQVFERAKREGIDITDPDLTYIRQMLTRKLADDAIKVASDRIKDSLTGERDENDRKVEHRTVESDQKVDEVYG